MKRKLMQLTPANLVESYQAARYRRQHGLRSFSPEAAALIAARRSNAVTAHATRRDDARVA
jgi:urease gamma subunit